MNWIDGALGDAEAEKRLVEGADAVVHAALHHPGGGFRGTEGDRLGFIQTNLLGTLRLIEAARAAGVGRFVFISTCAVHDRILPDRPLDETHPLWPESHYGAHKAAIEAFVHSYGYGEGMPICALRPTGIYGLAYPPRSSKWYSLVERIVDGKPVECRRGGKEVHASDVARAVEVLLAAAPAAITGEAFNCCDRYVSDHEVASIAPRLTGSSSVIQGEPTAPKNQIVTRKLEALGMTFGGTALLERTIQQMIDAVKTVEHLAVGPGSRPGIGFPGTVWPRRRCWGQGWRLRVATAEAPACSSGIASGTGSVWGSATTRSPRLTPETTSTKSGSLRPSSTRFHRQDAVSVPALRVRLMDGDVMLAFDRSHGLERHAGHAALGGGLEQDFGRQAWAEVGEPTFLDVDRGVVDPDVGKGAVQGGGDGGDLRHGAMQRPLGEGINPDDRLLTGLDQADLGLVDLASSRACAEDREAGRSTGPRER